MSINGNGNSEYKGASGAYLKTPNKTNTAPIKVTINPSTLNKVTPQVIASPNENADPIPISKAPASRYIVPPAPSHRNPLSPVFLIFPYSAKIGASNNAIPIHMKVASNIFSPNRKYDKIVLKGSFDKCITCLEYRNLYILLFCVYNTLIDINYILLDNLHNKK